MLQVNKRLRWEYQRRIRTVQLLAVTFLMVAGAGPFGLEELIAAYGYNGALLAVLIIPIVWSLPVVYTISRAAANRPSNAGPIVWTRATFGPFWSFLLAWLLLTSSIFDMAIYPRLFSTYLGIEQRSSAIVASGVMIMIAIGANLSGTQLLAKISYGLCLLLLPATCLLAWLLPSQPVPTLDGESFPLLAGLSLALWNYIGWEGVPMFAAEVNEPERTFPRAMLLALPLITGTYCFAIIAASHSGLPAANWTTGTWVELARKVAGDGGAAIMATAGALASFGLFATWLLSFSRILPSLALAGDLPDFFGWLREKNGAPWFSILFCGVLWFLSSIMEFKTLLEVDVLLYGFAMMIIFANLVASPTPNGYRRDRLQSAGLLFIPTVILAVQIAGSSLVPVGRFSALTVGVLITATGALAYLLSVLRYARHQ